MSSVPFDAGLPPARAWLRATIPERRVLCLWLETAKVLDGQFARIVWSPGGDPGVWSAIGPQGDVLTRGPLRDMLTFVFDHIGVPCTPAALDSIRLRLSDPSSLWDVVWVLGS